MPSDAVFHLSVPASSANLGPGYDTLALALELRMTALAQGSEYWHFQLEGEGAEDLPTDGNNLVARAYSHYCQSHDLKPTAFSLQIVNPIPVARGLGSSAAAIVIGMGLAQLAHEDYLDRDRLFLAAAAYEGHPDNIAAAVYGGLQAIEGTTSKSAPIHSDIRICLASPGDRKSTRELRKAVPDRISRHDAEATAAARDRLLSGLATGDREKLLASEEDRRHQPYRLEILESSRILFGLFREDPGITGAFLSGAGTTVGGWVLNPENPLSRLQDKLDALQLDIQLRLLLPATAGVSGEIHE